MQTIPNIADFCHDLTTEKKPWTHLNFLAGAGDNFNFAIIGDRTGRPEYGVSEQAMAKLNLLGPDFVMSVGDFVESFCVEDQSREFIEEEWDRFEKIAAICEPPFFHVVGNHDIASPDETWPTTHPTMEQVWRDRFGNPYYAFIRKGVLFLCLHTMELPGNGIGDEQTEWALKTLAENQDVKWTLVFMHCPNVWHTENFHRIEEALYERNYSVFAGDLHYYCRFRRNGRDYYMIGETGASTPEPGIPMRGRLFGEFQQIVWVSVRNGVPRVSLLDLDGILENNLVTVPKLTFLTATYFRADKPISDEEIARLRQKGIQADNSHFFEEV